MTSVMSPNLGLLNIKGSVNIDNALTVLGDTTLSDVIADTLTVSGISIFNNKVSVTNTDDIDLNSPALGQGALNVTGGGFVGGHMYVGGTLVANGDVITLGNSGGTLTLSSNISSNLNPTTTKTFDVGSPTLTWNHVYTTTLVLDTTPETVGSVPSSSININSSLSYIDATTASTATIADGEIGQVLTIVVVDTPTIAVVVTPTTANGYSSFTLTSSGDSISLIYTSVGWSITSTFRTSVTN